MLPLYRPGTAPKPPPFQIGNVQRRVVHHLSPPVVAPLDSPRDEPLLMSSAAAPSQGKKNIIFWIVGAILVFWVILVTLFFISHLAGSRHSIPAAAATTTTVAAATQNFALLPNQGRFLNVSLPPMAPSLTWHRTCCWQQEVLHCDGNGMFSTHVEKDVLVVRIIQLEIIGARCTFYGF